ncbi:TonB-dependent receptor [Niveispirillum fermenti]|uniref:TonB-dependent receptor n=1 Tax=Niveispirillum fermenti TaxID=1233113 RepID=UPI003A863205
MKLDHALIAGVSLAALLAAGLPAQAQQAGGEALSEIVVTAQRGNQTQVIRGGTVGVLGDKPAGDVPFAIKSYGSALILNQQPQTLGQVLENDPSVRTGYAFGNAAELFIVRGFPLFGDDIAIDGMYGLTPRQLIAPELYEQVQVLNGASAFLNGAAPGGSGLGGNVNLVPKRAGARPLARATLNYTGDEHIGGSFDMARRFGEGDQFGIRINGAARTGDVAIDGEFRSAYVLGTGLDWTGERARLSFDLAYQRMHVRNLRPKVTLGTNAIPDVPKADHNYGQSWSYSTLRDVFGILRGEYDVTENVTLYAAAGARDGSEKGIYDSITVTDVLTGAANGGGSYIPRTDNNEAAQAGIRAKLGTGAISHEINAGGSAVWQVNRNAYDFFGGFASNLYTTPAVAQPASAFSGGDLDDPDPISRTRLYSAYIADTLGAFDDKVLLTLGIRHQVIRTKSYAYGTGVQSGEYDESANTPVVGLVVKPAEGLSLYANRIQGLAQGPTAPIDVRVVNSGEVFAPYKSTQYEIGGKYDFGRMAVSLALFQTKKPSAFTRPVDAANPAGPLVFAMDGEQRNRGIELSLDGEPVDGLRLIGGFSLSDAELRKTAGGVNEGNDVIGVPDYTINGNVEWDLPFMPAVTLTGRVVRTGSQKVDAANTLSIPAWTRFDLGARYVFLAGDRPVTLRLNVDNVADKRYWASSYDAFATTLLQGAPRTFKLSTTVDF